MHRDRTCRSRNRCPPHSRTPRRKARNDRHALRRTWFSCTFSRRGSCDFVAVLDAVAAHERKRHLHTWRSGSRPYCSPPQSTSVSLPSSLQKSLAIKSFTLHHHILHLFFFFKHNLPSPPTFATACPEKTHCVPHFCSTPCYTKIFTQALGPFKTTSPSQQQ